MNNKLHILFVSNWFPNKATPNNGSFVQRHAKIVAAQNKVTIIHIQGIKGIKKTEKNIQKIEPNYTEILVFFPQYKIKLFNFFTKVFLYLKESKKIEHFDLIHANVLHYESIWLLFQKKPFVFSEHSSLYTSYDIHNLGWVKKKVLQLVFKRAKRIMPVSNYLGLSINNICPNLKYNVVPNVVNTNLFQPNSDEIKRFDFLHISNFAKEKNILGLLESIKILSEKRRDFKFLIAGNGNLEPLKKFRQEKQLENVLEFRSEQTHSEVAQLMNQSKCFVLFSKIETQGIVVFEAFASGLPVISTKVGGIPEFFPEDFGILIEENNNQQLVDAMNEVLNGKRFESAETMHNYIKERFSEDIIAAQFHHIYNEVLNLE